MLPKKKWQVIALYVGAALALLLAVVLLFALVVNGRVLPGTTVAGNSLGFSNKEEARRIVEEQLQNYEESALAIIVDGQSSQRLLSELGLAIDHARTLEDLEERSFSWDGGNPFVAAGQVFSPEAVRAVVTIDKDKSLAAIEQLTASQTTPPVDAQLIIEEGIVSVIPESMGQGFDASLVQAMLVNHVAELDPSALVLTSGVLEPTTTALDLETVRRQAEAFVAEPIVLSAAGKTLRVKAKEIGTWLTMDSAQPALASVDQAINKTIARFAEQVDTKLQAKIVVAGTDFVVNEGQAGTGIDQAAALQKVQQNILSANPARTLELAVTTLEPTVKEIGLAGAPSTGQGKEIVIVLSEQRLYAWESGTLANTSLVSTGLPGYDTPVGTFATFNHIKDHTMAGPGYYLPHVPNSMYFVGLIALHGAYWHNDFGQVKSHGCVNLPLDFAEWLFNWTPFGTTVRVVP